MRLGLAFSAGVVAGVLGGWWTTQGMPGMPRELAWTAESKILTISRDADLTVCTTLPPMLESSRACLTYYDLHDLLVDVHVARQQAIERTTGHVWIRE